MFDRALRNEMVSGVCRLQLLARIAFTSIAIASLALAAVLAALMTT